VIERVVSKGEVCLIGKAGKPVAQIIPYQPSRKPRSLGLLKGKIKLTKDWDTWPEEMAILLGIQEK
ncbi:MAG: type II toxin-antitoxin system prevent-host-death family antitoxin, partial [Deltaproteobacteria bacterium]|nr:type II toxin-antitoxin system prevent-host-death family antitoxin [Deltaproteobacteria bacterium]